MTAAKEKKKKTKRNPPAIHWQLFERRKFPKSCRFLSLHIHKSKKDRAIHLPNTLEGKRRSVLRTFNCTSCKPSDYPICLTALFALTNFQCARVSKVMQAEGGGGVPPSLYLFLSTYKLRLIWKNGGSVIKPYAVLTRWSDPRKVFANFTHLLDPANLIETMLLCERKPVLCVWFFMGFANGDAL